jgi:hydrogenase maturation protease
VKILVLGMGNDLYGDDGVGLHAVRVLKEKWEGGHGGKKSGDQVDFVECTLSGLALLDVVLGYDALVIIDTIAKSDPETGRIRFLEETDLRDMPGPSPHYVSVPQTLAIGRQMGLSVPRTVKIVAVEAKDLYRLGESLSEDMRRRLPDVVDAANGILCAVSAPPD